MVDIMADPERAWQMAMSLYFQEVDYHGLGQIFRRWNVKGTENQNGTWIEWNQVPELCQKDVKYYVYKVVESRRKQREWEDYVRRESIERSKTVSKKDEAPQTEMPSENSLNFEEKDSVGPKSDNWSKKNFNKRVGNIGNEELNPSQWVLERVPYPLAQNQPVSAPTPTDENTNIARWKKVGNLSHLILRDTHLRWVDEEYDPYFSQKDKEVRKLEEMWWKNQDGTIKKPLNDEVSRLDTYERDRVHRANRWMQNRNKFSVSTQKTLRKFRDFLRQQGTRNNFLICPASWAKNRREIVEDTISEAELDEIWEEEMEVDEESDKEWDEEEEERVNPWDRTDAEIEAELPKKKTNAKKKKKLDNIFESGTAVASKPRRKKN